ncbi:MAG: YgaP-like transmembrane domain, partial [Planctomycetaceae bacterium]
MSRLNLEQVAQTKVMTVHGLTDGVPGATPSQRQSCTKAQNISEAERWGSVLGGAALLLAGLQRGRLSGLITGLIGGSLLYRGYTGHCHAYDALGVSTADRPTTTGVRSGHGVKVEKTIDIGRSPAELFSFWRNLENLPKVMRHLERVETIDQRRSRWTARGPLATPLHWEAEIINEKEPHLIAWQSLPGSQVETAGSVHFKPAGDG